MSGEFLNSSPLCHSELDSDRSVQGDSPPTDPLLGKDDWSSAGSGDDTSYTEDTDDGKSDGDESECECKQIQHSDGTTIFTFANLHTILWWLVNYGDYGAEPILIKTFLHSCLGFTNAPVLFQNLMQIYPMYINQN